MALMLIDYYKAIEDSSRKMLDAALEDDWHQVGGFEDACGVLIEQLRQKSRDEVLSPELRAEKTRILRRILNNDAQIRCLAKPWSMYCAPHAGNSRQVLH